MLLDLIIDLLFVKPFTKDNKKLKIAWLIVFIVLIVVISALILKQFL